MYSLRRAIPGRYRIIKDWFNVIGIPKSRFRDLYNEMVFEVICCEKEASNNILEQYRRMFIRNFPELSDKFLEPKYRTIRLFKVFMRISTFINKYDETLDFQLYEKYPGCKELLDDILIKNWNNESKYDISYYDLFHDEKYKDFRDMYEYLKEYDALHDVSYREIKIDPEISDEVVVIKVYNQHLMNKP